MAKKKNDTLATVTRLEEKMSGVTALTRADPAKVGQAMVEAGVKQIQGEQQARLTQFISTSIQAVIRLKEEIELRQGWIHFHETRLEAVHAGAFKISTNAQIIFDDPALNEPGRGDFKEW